MNFEKFKKINSERPNLGAIDDPDAEGRYVNSGCGDDYRITLRIEDGVIRDAKFTTTGCGFGLVALSAVCEAAKGRTVEEAAGITPEEIERAVDEFPPRRKNYPVSALEAFQKALADYRARRAAPQRA